MSTGHKLTEGNMRYQLVALAGPLFVGNLLQQFYNTIDALIVGNYVGQEAFAALGIAGAVMNLLIFLIDGCCTGMSIVLATIYGNGRPAKFHRESFVSALFGFAFTVFLMSGSYFGMPFILRLIKTPPEVFAYTQEYLTIIVGGLLATLTYTYCSAWLRAVGDTTKALFFLAVALVINTILDFVMVGWLKMGIGGAAWATVIAQLISCWLCILTIKRSYKELIPRRRDCVFDLKLLKQTMNFAFITALHSSSLYVGKLLVQGVVNTLGTPGIAAYTATTRIEGVINSIGGSAAAAISVFCAQNLGANNNQRALDGFRCGRNMLFGLECLLIVIVFMSARQLSAIFVGSTPSLALDYSTQYLQIVVVFYLLNSFCNSFVGWFRGCGRLSVPVIGTTMHITVRIVISILLIHKYGLAAVAIATGAGWVCLLIYQCIVYQLTAPLLENTDLSRLREPKAG